jgi:hypothetical protein
MSLTFARLLIAAVAALLLLCVAPTDAQQQQQQTPTPENLQDMFRGSGFCKMQPEHVLCGGPTPASQDPSNPSKLLFVDDYTAKHSTNQKQFFRARERLEALFPSAKKPAVGGSAGRRRRLMATSGGTDLGSANVGAWLSDYLVWRAQQHKLQYVSFGLPAFYKQYPHAVSIQLTNYGNVHMCGGSLIDSRHILTAAHCTNVFKQNPSLLSIMRIVAGIVDADPTIPLSPFAQVRGVEALSQYDSYNDVTLQYDIAILRLDAEIDVSASQKYISAVPISTPETPQTQGIIVNVNGFGKTEGDTTQTKMHQVNVTIVPVTLCQDYYQQASDAFHICTQNPALMTASACQGDSGSGLLYLDVTGTAASQPASDHAVFTSQYKWIAVGLVSGGKAVSCGAANNPNFFTRVSTYASWIKGILSTYWYNTAPPVVQPPQPDQGSGGGGTPTPAPGGNTGGDSGGTPGTGGGGGSTPPVTSGASAAMIGGVGLVVATMIALLVA